MCVCLCVPSSFYYAKVFAIHCHYAAAAYQKYTPIDLHCFLIRAAAATTAAAAAVVATAVDDNDVVWCGDADADRRR